MFVTVGRQSCLVEKLCLGLRLGQPKIVFLQHQGSSRFRTRISERFYASKCNSYEDKLEDQVLMVLDTNELLNGLSLHCQCYHLMALSMVGLKPQLLERDINQS